LAVRLGEIVSTLLTECDDDPHAVVAGLDALRALVHDRIAARAVPISQIGATSPSSN